MTVPRSLQSLSEVQYAVLSLALVLASACMRATVQTPSTVPVAGVPVRPEVVTVVPFQLWMGAHGQWHGAWIKFPAAIDGRYGSFFLDSGAGDCMMNSDSVPLDSAQRVQLRMGNDRYTIHTIRVGTLSATLDSADIGPPIPQPSNAHLDTDQDPDYFHGVRGTVGLNGIEPFETIVDYVHHRLVFIRLDSAGRRLADVPAYTPAGAVPLVPVKVHIIPAYAAQWWGIEARRGGVLDTLLVDTGTQAHTDVNEVLAADELKQQIVLARPSDASARGSIVLPEPKAKDLNVLGYFFLNRLGIVGFNLRTRQLLLYR